MARWLLAIALTTGVTLVSVAQDEPAKGTQPGQALPGPFPAYIVGPKPAYKETLTEERQNFADPARVGKFHDLVTRYGLDPTVAVFLREPPPAEDQPVAQLLKSLDAAVLKHKNSRLHAFAIFLTLEPEEAGGDKQAPKFLNDDTRLPKMRAIEQFAAQAKLEATPLAIDHSDSARTKAYALNADSPVTVIVYENLRVRKRFDFAEKQPLDTAGVKAIVDEVMGMIKK